MLQELCLMPVKKKKMDPQNESPRDFRENEKRAKEKCGHPSVSTLLSQVTWEREDRMKKASH